MVKKILKDLIGISIINKNQLIQPGKLKRNLLGLMGLKRKMLKGKY